MKKAKNCIISCIDFRIQEAFFDWLKESHKLGVSDIIEVAGSTRDIAKPIKLEDKDELLRNIEISVVLHNPENIILVDHQDCGGYAQDNTIPKGLEFERDLKEHMVFAKIAKKELKEKFPKKVIKNFYIGLNNKIVEIH